MKTLRKLADGAMNIGRHVSRKWLKREDKRKIAQDAITKANNVRLMTDTVGWDNFQSDVKDRKDNLVQKMLYGPVEQMTEIRARAVELDMIIGWADNCIAEGETASESLRNMRDPREDL